MLHRQVDHCRYYLPREPSLTEEAATLRARAAWYTQLTEAVCGADLHSRLDQCVSELKARAEMIELSDSACASCIKMPCAFRQVSLIETLV